MSVERHPADLERVVREAILEFVHRGEPFTPLGVADRVAARLGGVPLARVAALVRRLDGEGLLKPFGYRRSLSQERTRQGVVTAVMYAPAARRSRAADTPPGSTVPTRAPASRPFGYLPIDPRRARRLDRQTAAIKSSMARSAEELIHLGELLEGVRALVGAEGLARYLDRELAMSADTARRLMRVRAVFAGHPALATLAVLRPTTLYVLSEPGFPRELREAILAEGGLSIDGQHCPLGGLKVRELRSARAQHQRRVARLSALDRAIALGTRDPSAARDVDRLSLERRMLASQPLTAIGAESIARRGLAMTELMEQARRLAESDQLPLGDPQRREAGELLQQLARRLLGDDAP